MSIDKLRQRLNVPPPSPVPQAAAPSLPPAPGEMALPPPPTAPLSAPVTAPTSGHAGVEKNSLIRKKAVAIVAMRAQGFSTDEIAAELHIKPASVATYVYRATKSGWLVNRQGSMLHDPKDRVEFELAHKVVRNLNEFMDSDDDTVRKEVTMEVAKGTIFKKFDQPKDGAPPAMQVLAVRIEMPKGAAVDVRADSMGGVPSYIEGEMSDD